MTRARRVVLASLGAAVLAVLAGPALAQAPTAPAVTITAPLGTGTCTECVRGTIALSAAATAAAGRTIASVAFEYSPANKNTWTPIATDTSEPFTASFNTTTATPGVYDIRAVATDSTGDKGTSVARDRVIANGGTFVSLDDPGPLLQGQIILHAVTPAGQLNPSSGTFQYALSGTEQWKDIGTVEAQFDESNRATFDLDFDPSVLPDGSYDLRIVATNGTSWKFVSRPRRERIVDTTAPAAVLARPAEPVQGTVTLAANAQDAGSGIASVRFERAPAGSGSWTAIGARARAPYTQDFDSRVLEDGAYDLRVVAIDRAGNEAASEPVRAVEVRNPGRVPPGELSIASEVAPANNLSLLGATGDGETWALGSTAAAPAVVDGAPLPYTSHGNQLVLLRRTERGGGWQIRDVLRNADGTPFVLQRSPTVIGKMLGTGEAWIALRQQDDAGAVEVAMFHRRAGGEFRRDPAATEALAPLLQPLNLTGFTPLLRLYETGDGTAYGVLVSPAATRVTPDGGLDGRDYGLLDGATWRRKTLPLPRSYTPVDKDDVRVVAADLTGPGEGWVALRVTSGQFGVPRRPPMIGRLSDAPWDPIVTGLDLLDVSDKFSVDPPDVTVTGLRADRGGVWIGADADFTGASRPKVVAYYDEARGDVTESWCQTLPRPSTGCAAPLDADHPAAVPEHVFYTNQGKIAVALSDNFLDIYQYGGWSRAAAPDFKAGGGAMLLSSATGGWLAGSEAFGRVSATPAPDPLATWPQSNRSTLLSVALPPGGSGAVGESGALAVGLDGTALAYDKAAGWQVQTTPARVNRLALRSVAFSGSSRAFAVGNAGAILRWDGASWSEDPQSSQLTRSDLLGVAFRNEREGWAVGRFGTILHFDGGSWTEEDPPAEDAESGATISSVAVAGDDVFAISDGDLIERAGGRWRHVERDQLPDEQAAELPFADDLRLVSGLPDGGVVAAGRSVVIARRSAGERFAYAPQPFEGIAVALSAFRDGDGSVRAFVSSAPPVNDLSGNLLKDVGGFPAGDGVLLRQTADGWTDLSRSQLPGRLTMPLDGLVKPDPVLAVAAGAGGDHAWAVGGYAGTRSAAGQGTDEILPARATGWRTAHIWRYDAGGPAMSPADQPAGVVVPAQPGVVSFAFFSSAQCKWQCLATRDAQPDVNLAAAARSISAFAEQPGGPSFAVLGGNARGPSDLSAWAAGNGASEFLRLPRLLAPLGSLPLFAAYGPRDPVPTAASPAQPWADAFAQAPAPFGPRPAPAGVEPVDAGGAVGGVHRYYAFDARQNGAVIRVLVLDNSDGPLDSDQRSWLNQALSAGADAGRIMVAVLGRPLASGSSDDVTLAYRLMDGGVRAVFAGGETNQLSMIPSAAAAATRIPQFAGATVGYQRSQNNGVAWYSVAVDTRALTVTVNAIPVIDELALKPQLGLTVARSSTLAFEAVGRRPKGTLATTPNDPTFPGFDNYVTIPAPACTNCIPPAYRFASSDPTIGDFVLPSGPGSRYPKLDADGHPIPSPTSGLFCAYNSGSTTVSVTAGLRTASLPVTVLAGGIGRPCGTVFREGVRPVVLVPSSRTVRSTATPGGTGAPTSPPPGTSPSPAVLPKIAIPFPPPPAPAVKPPPVAPVSPPPVIQPVLPAAPAALSVPLSTPSLPPVAVPPIPPGVQPIPPGGAASAQAAARRKEKARKHASQSAYVIHEPGDEWFYITVGGVSVLTLLLIAGGVRPGSGRRPAPAELRLDAVSRPRGGRR